VPIQCSQGWVIRPAVCSNTLLHSPNPSTKFAPCLTGVQMFRNEYC
jgi:hypothetical protein